MAQLPSKPLAVQASEAHLVRAMSNLMHNGVEAIAGDGQLTMTAGQRRLTEAMVGFERIEPGDYAVVSVSDTGRGIPQEDLAGILSPSQHQAPGRIERHRSWPRHRSWRGEGAWRFRRCHQRARSGHDLHAVSSLPSFRGTGRCSADPDAGAAGRPSILLVDDSPILLRTGRRVLEHLGYKVETLESGKEAYQRFERAAATGKSPCDLVILDMSLLEERDGLEIFEMIRKLFPISARCW